MVTNPGHVIGRKYHGLTAEAPSCLPLMNYRHLSALQRAELWRSDRALSSAPYQPQGLTSDPAARRQPLNNLTRGHAGWDPPCISVLPAWEDVPPDAIVQGTPRCWVPPRSGQRWMLARPPLGY